MLFTVFELESQIDSFEAEMKGLSVKKGKARPPRLTHLESSVVRHKAHIMKLELILRLLDNDEMSPEQVKDVKDFIDDYVERNQEDFDEFEDVDMLYNTLSPDKVEALKDLVIIGPPGLVKGVGATVVVLSTKNDLSSPLIRSPGASVQEQTEETLSQENISKHGPRTPPPKAIDISSSPPTPSGTQATPITVPTPFHHLTSSSVPPSPSPVRGVLENSVSNIPSSPINKEEEVGGFPIRKSSPALSESGLRNLGRGSLTSLTSPSSVAVPINPVNSNIISTINALVVGQDSELSKRHILGTDERMVRQHPPVSSLSSRMMLQDDDNVKLNVSLLKDISDDIDFCFKLAKEESLILLLGLTVGLKSWIRVTFATDPSSLEEALDRVKSFCQKHSHQQKPAVLHVKLPICPVQVLTFPATSFHALLPLKVPAFRLFS
ncbi:unnamed protein product [Lactuca virosa]|uniref:CCR4-Not complex component Not N-terminal domain-containing protein n=1 Tax=Lactuca virosa TaxID=75947 RepID=A0AAU9NEV7_9ASTR|nr:unnamed protein product [Lactuca virosa]